MSVIFVFGIIFLVTLPFVLRFMYYRALPVSETGNGIEHRIKQGDRVLFFCVWSIYELLVDGLHIGQWQSLGLIAVMGLGINMVCKSIAKSSYAKNKETVSLKARMSQVLSFSTLLYAVNIVFLALAACGCIFVNSMLFTDTQILPKWICLFATLSLLVIIDALSYIVGYEPPFKSKSAIVAIMATMCVVEAAYGIIDYNAWISKDVVTKIASFDNVAGFASCLCFGLPFVLAQAIGKRKVYRYLWGFGVCVILVALFVCRSRTGWLACASALLVASATFWKAFALNYNSLRMRRIVTVCVFAVTSALFAMVLYHSSVSLEKRNSIEGRKLIWSVAWNMIKDKPITGHGYGSVEREYMLYQAQYLGEANANQHIAGTDNWNMVADNVKHVFNEYLAVAVQFGIVGVVAVLAAIVLTTFYYMKHRRDACSYQSQTLAAASMSSLASICVFSLFSYPFAYPFTWFILIVDLLIVFAPAICRLCKYGDIKSLIIGGMSLLAAIIVFSMTGKRCQVECNWRKAYDMRLMKNDKNALDEYAAIYRNMRHFSFIAADATPYFLYNYAAELNADGQYERSLQIANECSNYWADYDLEMLKAYNYKGLDKNAKATGHFLLAHKMCPNRFEPLYNVMLISKAANDQAQAKRYAKMIVNKSIKVYSPAVVQMRDEAQMILEKDNKSNGK